MDWISKRPIAHRGLHRGAAIPENSMIAFAAAIEKNHPIELDVQLLADGAVVVFHDADLERTTGQSGHITDQTTDTLKQFRLFGTEHGIPLLKEVLQFVDGKVPILIEIKNEGSVGALERALHETVSDYAGEFAIQAFNPFSLQWFRRNAPQIIRGQLSGSFEGEDLAWYKKLLLRNLLMNWSSAPHFVSYELKALPNLPTTLARSVLKVPLIGWTVTSESDHIKALKYCDNVLFDSYS